ncbi:type II secretion system protein [Candidatus Nomurabacteria bacterium]|nr:type II secretion system protein [Candidatus Nomurabacteria bacterium]
MIKKKNKKGFTLVELLVVISIIGILSSVAVINLNSAREDAKNAAALGEIKALQTEAILCLDSGANLQCTGLQCSLSVPTPPEFLCYNFLNNWRWPTIENYSYRKIRSNYQKQKFCLEIQKTSNPNELIVCTDEKCFEHNDGVDFCQSCVANDSGCSSDSDCCSYNCGTSNKCQA